MNRIADGTRLLFTGLALAFALLISLLAADTGQAKAPVEEYGLYPSTTQAGGHPDVKIKFKVGNRRSQGFPDPCFCNDPKDIIVNLPQGFIGNPHVTPQCTAEQFALGKCPIDSQVGMIAVLIYDRPGENNGGFLVQPIFNMEPPPGTPGLLAFAPSLGPAQYIYLKARTGGDFGLTATVTGLQRVAPVLEILQYMWGVPADPVHDLYRGYYDICQAGEVESFFDANEMPVGSCGSASNTPRPSSSPLLPFLSNPTVCSGPLQATLETTSFDKGTDEGSTTYPAITGCGQLTFNPSLSAKPTTIETDAASGLDIDLSVPQIQSAFTPSPSQIKKTVLTLPEGFSINPNAADGKTVCRDDEANFGSEGPAECPDFSKVGSTVIDSSALPGPIGGYLYLGEPLPGDRYRLILTAEGFATNIKLSGSIKPDPETGRLVTTFDNLPQSPLTEFNLHVFGAERGVLATPTRCGTYAVQSTFTPWNDVLPEQSATQFFTLDSGPVGSACPGDPRPLAPTFTASSAGNTGGAHSPFAIELSREDGSQNLSGLTVKTPPGFSATLKGVSYCPETALDRLNGPGYSGVGELASSACPANSQIGTATGGAGVGSRPLYVPGKVYLAGPYKGAPLSLVVVIPAVSGPYDLGNVAVRAAISVDPETAQVTAISDPLPRILEGILLRTRFLQVKLDRPGFALNPTNCDPFTVEAIVTGTEGSTATRGSDYQAANCARLPFAPKLALKLTGSTKQAGNPALTATLTAKPGEANISRAKVTLPPTELVDNAHIRNICTRVQFNEGNTPGEKCPPGTILGFAKANTSLLDKPLEGPIYLRSTGRAGLPDVVAALNGQIDIVLVGHIDSVQRRLRTTFESVPDAPVTKVVLKFYGGERGLIENSPRLCAHAQHFTAAITGQNGKTLNRRPVLSTPCGKKQKHKARAHHERGSRR
ncbi:MAG TPA: hypothetical protein VIT85_08860 [Solirubrobacterales bacterium]